MLQCGLCEKNYTVNEFCKVKKCTCGCEFDKETWQIQSKKEIFVITTTHLGVGMINNADFSDFDNNYFYETMIFEFKGKRVNYLKSLGFQARYKTKHDAIEGHKLAFDKLEMILLNPDKYPKGIIDIFCNLMNASRDASITQQKKDMR